MTGDRLTGLGIAGAGAALLLFGIPMGISAPSNVRVAVLSPLFWPTIIAWAMVVGGVLLLFRSRRGSRRPVGQGAVPTAVEDAVSGSAMLRIAALAILMFAYYLAIPVLGMVLASGLAYLTVAVLLRARHRVAMLVTAIALPLSLYLFFYRVAGVPLPGGWLEGWL